MERPLRIMIVEDEFLIALDAEMALTDAGHDVVAIVGTEDEAVEKAIDEKPDLMVVDLRLANGGRGSDAVKRVRSVLDVVVIFASGNLDPAMRERLAKFKPLAMLSKPYGNDELVRAVAAA